MDVPTVSADALEAQFEAMFPTFEAATGWRMEGKYPPLDPALEAELRRFFQPYNAALQRYLGRHLGWDDGPRAAPLPGVDVTAAAPKPR